jgi:heme-degrading monooxygenase HmoA
VILRAWTAYATNDNAKKYVAFFNDTLVPQLRQIPGHRGAMVLQRRADDAIEIIVHTFWDSMTAIERFAGADSETAVVEPEAAALLLSFDKQVKHFDVHFNSYEGET